MFPTDDMLAVTRAGMSAGMAVGDGHTAVMGDDSGSRMRIRSTMVILGCVSLMIAAVQQTSWRVGFAQVDNTEVVVEGDWIAGISPAHFSTEFDHR